MNRMVDAAFWQGRQVFITGHTGFMGGWLASLLLGLGAKVSGYALAPQDGSGFFEATDLGSRLQESVIGDVRDTGALEAALVGASPSVVFHLAAQPLVRRAYSEPEFTFGTNVMGTVNLLEAVRRCPSVKAVLVVTTDKVYANMNTTHPYCETDRLGGREPYSASKAAAEMVVDAYRHSYFVPPGAGDGGVGLAAIRAGNIFGGGDWAADRIVPDAVRSFQAGRPLVLRNPASTRPWQHVLDPLPGYLRLAENLCADPAAFSEGWNFGPIVDDCRPVGTLARLLGDAWGEGAEVRVEPDNRIFEEQLLALDSAKAGRRLGWTPRWNLETAVARTVEWYKAYYSRDDVWALTQSQCATLMKAA